MVRCTLSENGHAVLLPDICSVKRIFLMELWGTAKFKSTNSIFLDCLFEYGLFFSESSAEIWLVLFKDIKGTETLLVFSPSSICEHDFL